MTDASYEAAAGATCRKRIRIGTKVILRSDRRGGISARSKRGANLVRTIPIDDNGVVSDESVRDLAR